MNPEYKKFILTAIKFIFIFAIIDFGLGSFAQYIFFKQSSGKFFRLSYSLESASADIIIFGSSHANRHYVPTVFNQRLNLSCYNAGVQGQRMLFQTALEEIVLDRIAPKIIVFDIDRDLLCYSTDAYDRLSDLNPYYWKFSKILQPIIDLKTKHEHLKLFLKSYQYNSTLIHILSYLIFPQPDINGYVSLRGKIDPLSIDTIGCQIVKTKQTEIDSNLLNAFHMFIAKAKEKNVILFLVTSPSFNRIDLTENQSIGIVKEIAKKNNISYFNFLNDFRFLHNYQLFNDQGHLNNFGATLFSELVSDSIIKYNKQLKKE